MLTSRNTTTTILGVIIAAGLVIIGSGAGTAIAAPLSAFALLPPGVQTTTNIVNGASSSSNQVHGQNISSPKMTNNQQMNDPSSNRNVVNNSFGVGTANQNNHQAINAGTLQDVVPQGTNTTTTTTTVSQVAPNLNIQEFKSNPTATLFCILTSIDSSSC